MKVIKKGSKGEAVKKFQSKAGLTPDGIVGAKTIQSNDNHLRLA